MVFLGLEVVFWAHDVLATLVAVSYRIHSWKVKKILQEKMSRHSDEYNPMLDDYNDPEFNSYTSQGFKTTKSSKSGGLIDRAQNPTYELHISRIPIGNFFYIFLLFVLLFSK